MRKIQQKNSPPENAEEEAKQILKDIEGEFEERIMSKVTEVIGKMMIEINSMQEKRQEESRNIMFDEFAKMNEK
jgi:hypothetical protein